MKMDPESMSLRGRMGAYRMHATHDPRETTVAARQAFRKRFERDVDPSGELRTANPAEFERRVEAARSAYYAGLAFKSARARAIKAATCKTCGQVA